jgi:hypothetical protein
MQITDIPEVSNTLSELRGRFENFDTSGLYERYQHLVSAVTEWKISANGEIFAPLPYSCEIIIGKSPRLIKRKYKNVEEAMWLGQYCSGFLDGECAIVIYPVQKGLTSRHFSLFEKRSTALEEIYAECKFVNIMEKRTTGLGSLSKYIDMPDNKRAKIRVAERGNFSVSLYAFTENGKPIYVKVSAKGWRDDVIYYFHYSPDGEMYKISNDEAGKHICFPLKIH